MSVRIVQNRRYPVAPNPWKGGIQPYDDVHGRLPVTVQGLDPYFDPAYKVVFEFTIETPTLKETIKYECLPHCTFDDPKKLDNWYVVYYVAANVTYDPHTWDYAISPDRLDEFIRNAKAYHTKANTVQAPTLSSGSSRLPGARYPASPSAWKRGISLYPVARPDLPVNDVYVPPNEYHLWLEFTYMRIANKRFRVVPHVTGTPRPQVLYYIVMEVGARAPLYAVSPDKLDFFADHVEEYLFIAAATYPRTKVAANSARVVDLAMRGEWGNAFSALGNAWKDAVKDPEWWVMSFAIPTTGAIVTRGAGAATRQLPQNVEAGIKGSSPYVITGRHMRPGNLDSAVQAYGRNIVYRVKTIRFTGAQTAAEVEAVSVAREAHRQMLQRSAQLAQSQGQKTFTFYGVSAGPDFVKHANKLAQKIGVPGSGKVIPNAGAPFADYQVTLSVAKVQAADPTALLSGLAGGLKGEDDGGE